MDMSIHQTRLAGWGQSLTSKVSDCPSFDVCDCPQPAIRVCCAGKAAAIPQQAPACSPSLWCGRRGAWRLSILRLTLTSDLST